jgi:hypothetical protein
VLSCHYYELLYVINLYDIQKHTYIVGMACNDMIYCMYFYSFRLVAISSCLCTHVGLAFASQQVDRFSSCANFGKCYEPYVWRLLSGCLDVVIINDGIVTKINNF